PWPMWRELLTAAPDELSRALAAMEAQLRTARIAIERHDAASLGDAWEHARSWRSRAGDAS
ncbi:MAG: hypothetical protein M3081_09340, partial [Gemmatimonadota bacterium]|nr:hypothetical protein [Gemmatimonadota bacterium]